MDNNKNKLRTEDKSKSELRKMFPHDGDVEIATLEDIKKPDRQEGASLRNTTTRK